jgi:hypothetical protein
MPSGPTPKSWVENSSRDPIVSNGLGGNTSKHTANAVTNSTTHIASPTQVRSDMAAFYPRSEGIVKQARRFLPDPELPKSLACYRDSGSSRLEPPVPGWTAPHHNDEDDRDDGG